MMQQVLDSDWGRLFRNWETLTPTADGFPDVGTDAAEITRVGAQGVHQVARHPRHVHQGSAGVLEQEAAGGRPGPLMPGLHH